MNSTIFNFENIGERLQNFAKWMHRIIVGIVWLVSLIMLVVITYYRYLAPYWLIPVAAAIVVPIISWISNGLIYAFGELVDATSNIEHYTKTSSIESTKIEKLRSRGIITEEECQQAMPKPPESDKIDPESLLRNLNYQLNLKIITREEYEAQRAEIIKKL